MREEKKEGSAGAVGQGDACGLGGARWRQTRPARGEMIATAPNAGPGQKGGHGRKPNTGGGAGLDSSRKKGHQGVNSLKGPKANSSPRPQEGGQREKKREPIQHCQGDADEIVG